MGLEGRPPMIATQDPFRESALRGASANRSPAGDAPDRSRVAAARHGRVLVIDDELTICTSLKRVFSRHHAVHTVTSAPKALELFRAGERFDVVLCDLMMPEMNGIDLFNEVRRLSQDQASRFMFMSGASLSSQVSAFLATIPNTMISKPFDMRRLTDLVKDKLSHT